MSDSNSAPRVVHFSSVHGWRDVRVFRRTCRSLAAAGYDVHLIAVADEGEVPSTQVHEGVTVHSFRRAANRYQRMFKTTRQVVAKALDLNGALYHFHDPELIPFTGRLVKTGRPVIYDAHEDLPKTLIGKDWLPRPVGLALQRPVAWIERSGSRRFAAVVATEDEIEAQFRGRVARTLTIQNYPVLAEFPRPTPELRRTHPETIVHFGGLRQLRAIEPLIDAMGRIPADLDVRLLTAGRCDSDALLQQLQAKPGFARVEHLGWLSHEQMRRHLGESSLAMNLFSKAPNNQRVRSNRFYESLAAAVPVITSDFPEWKRVVDEIGCGLCVDSDDPAAIANAITRLLTDRNESQAMGARGRAAIETRFNWESEFAKLRQLYEELIGPGEV